MSAESHSIITTKHHNPRHPHTVTTHHSIDKFRNGVDERPDPFSVCLRVHSAAGCSDGRTCRGLQGVNLEEMKSPKKKFWAAAPWEEVFFPEHAPHLAHDEQACAKGHAEGMNFGRRCSVGAGELVHDVSSNRHETRSSMLVELVVIVVDVKVAAVLRGGHWGRGGRDGRCCCVVWCVVLDVW